MRKIVFFVFVTALLCVPAAYCEYPDTTANESQSIILTPDETESEDAAMKNLVDDMSKETRRKQAASPEKKRLLDQEIKSLRNQNIDDVTKGFRK